MKKKVGKAIKEYCVGCGLCEACGIANLIQDEKGYLHPENLDEEWMLRICPCTSENYQQLDKGNIWGKYIKRYIGWSTDDEIRKMASSGGIITALSIFLLENNYIDEVMHVCKNSDDPTKTEICFSKTKKELVERCGSRYSISHPLREINKLDKSKKYLFIAKPCDIDVLRNYEKINPVISEIIPIKISFFCAGLPSSLAQVELLRELGCDKICTDLKYRGNGWPGMVTAIDEDGSRYTLEYEKAWGKILGRDIMKMCRMCSDGIGEQADISCGDYWYIDNDSNPDFSEHEGRNVVFARTKLGSQILDDAMKQSYVYLEDNVTDEGMYYSQKYQHIRKSTMISKLIALKFLGRSVPFFSIKDAACYAKFAKKKTVFRIFLGTIRRAINGNF